MGGRGARLEKGCWGEKAAGWLAGIPRGMVKGQRLSVVGHRGAYNCNKFRITGEPYTEHMSNNHNRQRGLNTL